MKKIVLLCYCLAVCAVLCACVAKKEFAGTSPSSSAAGAEAAAEASAAPEAGAEHLFPWRGYTLNAKVVVDDGSVTDANHVPEGRLIQVTLECADGTMDWTSISTGYKDFSLQDAAGNAYTPISVSFNVPEGTSLDIRDLDSGKFTALSPNFDIPEAADIRDFTLYVQTETAGERITVPLKEVEIRQ